MYQQSDSISLSCVHPIRVVNPRFRKFSEEDRKTLCRLYDDYFVTAPCGKCYLCRKKRANQWRLRLINEFEHSGKNAFFITYTFNNENYHYTKELALVVRRWRQNYKYKFGFAPRYFFTEDVGSQFGRLHLHGILFAPTSSLNEFVKAQKSLWPYGYFSVSKCKSVKAMSYVSGYVAGLHLSDVAPDGLPMKHGKVICKKAREFIPKTYVSKGIGKKFADSIYMFCHYDSNGKRRLFPFYKVDGKVYPLPRYYQQLIFSDIERHFLKLKYKGKVQDTLFNYKDKEDMLKYVVNGTKLTEFGKSEKFRQYITIYEENSDKPRIEIEDDIPFEDSFIYELNLAYDL